MIINFDGYDHGNLTYTDLHMVVAALENTLQRRRKGSNRARYLSQLTRTMRAALDNRGQVMLTGYDPDRVQRAIREEYFARGESREWWDVLYAWSEERLEQCYRHY